MELSGLIPLFINGGVPAVTLAVFIYLLVSGHLVPGRNYQEKHDECEELKKALNAERARGDAAVAAASTTRDLLLAIGGKSALVPEDKE